MKRLQWAWLLAGSLMAGETSVPGGTRTVLLADCADPASAVATITEQSLVRVQSGFFDGSRNCYSVTVQQGNQQLRGYLAGEDHPAVVSFQREKAARARSVAELPPAAPAAPEEGKAAPPKAPAYFPDFSAGTLNGGSLTLSKLPGRLVLLYFYDQPSDQSPAEARTLSYYQGMFQEKGLSMVGVTRAQPSEKFRNWARDRRAIWPQVLDRGELFQAAGAGSGPKYFLLDANRKILMQNSNVERIEDVMSEILNRRR